MLLQSVIFCVCATVVFTVELSQAQGNDSTAFFKTELTTRSHCHKADSENCDLSSYSNCENGTYEGICYSTVTNCEVKRFLQSVHLITSTSPFVFGIFKPNKETLKDMHSSKIADHIIHLRIWDVVDFNIELIDPTSLKNLLQLEFIDSMKIVLTKVGLQRFSKLRALTLTSATVESLDPAGLEAMGELRSLVLDHQVTLYSWSDMSNAMKGYLHRLHCKDAFAGARSFLEKRRDLLVERKIGEIYNVSGIESPSVVASKFFDVYDCSKKT